MSTSYSPSLQSIVSTGMSAAGSSHEAGYWIDTSCTDFATLENRVLRIDVPGETRYREVANETADPVDSSTSAVREEASLEETRCQAVADAVKAGLLETLLAAKAVQVEVTVRLPDSSRHRDFHPDTPKDRQSHLAVTDKPVDVSAFTASEEAFLRRCLNPSLPPAYVDAVIRIVSQSRIEMVQELEKCLDQRTQQLYQAVNVIENLIREKKQLEDKAVHLEQTRSHLRKIHAALRGVPHKLVEGRHGASIR